jgi:hypothetical protein
MFTRVTNLQPYPTLLHNTCVDMYILTKNKDYMQILFILMHGFHAQFENPSKLINVIIVQFGTTLHTNTQHLLCSGL